MSLRAVTKQQEEKGEGREHGKEFCDGIDWHLEKDRLGLTSATLALGRERKGKKAWY